MRIVLDGMGGDHAPESVVEGAVMASKEIEHQILITGPVDLINSELSKYEYDQNKILVIDATEVISCDEAPVRAVRSKKDSSLVVGINLVKDGKADAFISGGSTGAILAGGLFILGRIKGIDRPALASIYPILGKHASLLLDAGANAECKPNNLMEFGIMGSIYADKVLGYVNPKVGLVNIGTESQKGSMLTREAYQLLKTSPINFVGNVEARDVPKGACDVVVTDGFTGNVLLKLTEGFAWNTFRFMKNKFQEGKLSKLGAVLLVDKLRDMKKEFDYSEYGGAPILGVKGPILKMHGSSGALACKNAILKAIPYVEGDIVGIIENNVSTCVGEEE